MIDRLSIDEDTENGWSTNEIEHVNACPVCGGTDWRVLYENLNDRLFGSSGKWNFRCCKTCDSAWLSPRPTRQSIYKAYATYPTHNKKPQRNAVGNLSRFQRLKRSIANGYRNWRFGSQFHPASRLGALIRLLPSRQRSKLNRELRYLPRFSRNSRVLDIGAGNGEFLAVARDVGWEVIGIEPDKVAAANARELGIEIRNEDLEHLTFNAGSFDAITMNHVIEHLHDPLQVLKRAYDLLKPQGMLYIETPNINAYGHRRFGPYWRGLEPPRHLVLFNWVSLEDSLKKVGFDSVRRYPKIDVYANIAAVSRAIREEDNPMNHRSSTLMDKFVGLGIGFKTMVDCRDSEFITLVAVKKQVV